ncbi:MAG: hypothetical protein JXD21_04015 [Candidatus Omnitrophica bacterium]|nr:hypothetical protein [Candidatus Omnitrophota bacterium]
MNNYRYIFIIMVLLLMAPGAFADESGNYPSSLSPYSATGTNKYGCAHYSLPMEVVEGLYGEEDLYAQNTQRTIPPQVPVSIPTQEDVYLTDLIPAAQAFASQAGYISVSPGIPSLAVLNYPALSGLILPQEQAPQE